MILEDILSLLVSSYMLLFIIGGLTAASWLIVRFAGIEDVTSNVNRLALLGFPLGIFSIITVGAGVYLKSLNLSIPQSFDIITIFLLALLGIILILRPIKDFRFGVFLSLAIGLLGAALLIFLGSESVKLLSGVFILTFFLIYGAIRFFEDLYLLIADLLASPLVSVSIGVLCIIQGLLGIFGVSLGLLIPFL
ncbi:hypothetical protein [Candidatus Hodarchaeum mangrovi]